ncbi:MAG: FMN-binding protein [Paludibacteraceae bacterium]
MKLKFLIVFLFSASLAFSQGRMNQQRETVHEVSNKDVVQSIYPTAAEVKKANDYWYNIIDNQGKVLGYAMNSKTYCQDVIGYRKQTPVMIITSKNGEIRKVALLTNYETPGYVNLLEKNGFFNLWNGKNLKEAQQVEIDGYSGATVTALAVEKNVKFLLEKGLKVKPKSR